MNVRLKRAKELAGYAVQLTRTRACPPWWSAARALSSAAASASVRATCPPKRCWKPSAQRWPEKRRQTAGLPTISVLTPLYNTPEKYLREFLDSFVDQTAPNGQLCLADASDAAHRDVERIVKEYQQKNQRIVYKKIENKGIAANTNAAAACQQGNIWRWPTTTTSWRPTPCTPWARPSCSCGSAGRTGRLLYSDEALFTKSIQRPHGGPLQAGLRPGLPAVLQLHLPSGGVPKGAVGGAGRRTPGVRRQSGPRPVPASVGKDRRRGPCAAGALLLAGARGLHLRRHRRQALRGGSSQKGAGRPPDPHRPHRHRGGWPVPQHLPGEVGHRGRPEGEHPHPQQGPHRRSGKVPAQHLDKDRVGEL